jgi:8-oxo-dGTP diphosphatase
VVNYMAMASDDTATRAYYDSLPGKRIGAGLICRDADERILLVQPTYKPTWEIPGGVVEAGESPAAAVAREVREELGVDLPVWRLLVVDWLPVRPSKTEGLMMQFDGGVLDDAVTRRFRLAADELADWRFFAPDELDGVLPDFMARRVRIALEMAATGRSAYLEWGRLPDESSDSATVSSVIDGGPGSQTLLLMKGPPGSGKSTIARWLGRRLGWPVIDKDAVRDLLPDELGGLSYEAMLGLAERQLAIGLSVIADSPLGYGASYARAVDIGRGAGAGILVIECACSDEAEWQRRIQVRSGTGLPSHHTTDWSKVEAFYERTAADPYDVDVPLLVVDTATPVEQSLDTIMAWLEREPPD